MKKTFETLDEELLPIVYTTHVRPLLEYGNAIWHPRYTSDIIKVERVQRRATKIIPTIRDKPYEDRLKKLKLYSMEYRRKRGDMIQVYKILKGIDNIEADIFFVPGNPRTRGHSKKLYKPKCKKEVRKNVFSNRIIDNWNTLTEDIVSSKTLKTFKERLDKHWEKFWYKIGIK